VNAINPPKWFRAASWLAMTLVVLALVPLVAQERIDDAAYWKIRQEGTTRSSVLHTVHVLADRFSPRLTGSPTLKAAGEWAIEQMRAWGLQNARLEPWDFNRPGWTNERLTAHIVSPVKDALVVEALGWTPGTNGVARGSAIGLTPPQRATRAEYTAYLETIKPRLAGAMVLVGVPRQVQVTFAQPALRREDADVATQMAPAEPAAARAGGPAPQQQPPAQPQGRGQGQGQAGQSNRPLTAAEMDNLLNEFLVANGTLVRINDAARAHGQIRAFNNRTYDPAKSPPTVVMRNEDYGRIWRLMNGGPTAREEVRTRAAAPARVELEFEIVNRMHPEGRTSYNAIAEIPGGDKADEIVMLGAHLDAWHAGTGATDNAVGCAVMMEAARILTAAGLKPRRTIRLALWSGEEQGLYGSQAHVREHFGTVEEPKPAFAKFAGYVNMDTGTGRVRGMTVFGPTEAATVLRQATAPFADLGVLGANATTSRTRGSTDHSSFNWAGLPGINLLQDPIEYSTTTWHTNLDTYERIVEDDVKKAAIVVAGLIYHLAIRDEPLPRLPREQMPRRPQTAENN
jgi:carboxypeptidase Q